MKKEYKEALVGVAWAGAILLLSLGAKYAFEQGYIDREMQLRTLAMNGLAIIYYGNRLPKVVAPNANARQVARVAGWSYVLSGLAYLGLWLFAPISLARTVGSTAVVAGIVVTLGYSLRLAGRGRAGEHRNGLQD